MNFAKITKRNVILGLYDSACFWVISFIYYFLSKVTTGSADILNFSEFIKASVMMFCVILLVRILSKSYGNVWRYTSTKAYFNLVISDFISGIITIVVSFILKIQVGFWFYVTIAALNVLCSLFSRYSYRLLYKIKRAKNRENIVKRKNIFIIGAGQLGSYLASELKNNISKYNPVAFIDNNPSKIGLSVSGLYVYSEEKISQAIEKYDVDEVVIAIDNISPAKLSGLKTKYEKLGFTVKLYETPFYKEQGEQRVIREFSIEDLLFRNQHNINDETNYEYYKNKVVLITGGGGSIGSELCRGIAKCSPKKLIIFDIYENNAYEIQQELKRIYGNTLDLSVEIGSIRDVDRLEFIFNKYKPQVVFHAAAHKHVPLMETSASEAIKNNVFGTYNTANAAERHAVEKFILISTDKAVNPTNIMGATKRICEMIIQCRQDSKTSFSAVRFGNVLGSNGSVIPLFKSQIAQGGPVTITDKRIIRYFMTIPEASNLVINAGAMAKSGELFVLDMGKPVKIYDLARNMIILSGFTPDKDIKIIEIGLRPGEKLYEELLIKSENLDRTSNKLIFIEKDQPKTRKEVDEIIQDLKGSVQNFDKNGDISNLKSVLKTHVSTYMDPCEVNNEINCEITMEKLCNNK